GEIHVERDHPALDLHVANEVEGDDIAPQIWIHDRAQRVQYRGLCDDTVRHVVSQRGRVPESSPGGMGLRMVSAAAPNRKRRRTLPAVRMLPRCGSMPSWKAERRVVP